MPGGAIFGFAIGFPEALTDVDFHQPGSPSQQRLVFPWSSQGKPRRHEPL